MNIIIQTSDKKYYWIKLRTDFFFQDSIDFIMSQKNGSQYVALYIMLCINTANTGGKLAVNVGEYLVPYNIEKIVRDTRFFDVDTVTIALELFKKFGLIYEEENKIFKISNYDKMVGSETASAERKRKSRANKKELECHTNNCDIVTQENRDKIIDIREENKNNILHTYDCHLLKTEKDTFCLGCQKKNVCNKPTSNGFNLIYGCSFEDYLKRDKEQISEVIIDDYDWLNGEENDY